MQDLTLKQLKICINKIRNEIKDEDKSQALVNYLFGDKKEKLPDHFKNDLYVQQFIEYIHDFVKKFERDKDLLRIFLLIGLTLILTVLILTSLGLIASPIFFAVFFTPHSFELFLPCFLSLSFTCFPLGAFGVITGGFNFMF